MNPTAPTLTPEQQNKLKSVMSTNTTPQQPPEPQTQTQPANPSPDPNTLSGNITGGQAPLGTTPTSPLGGPAPQLGQNPQATYQVPTVGMPTSPTIGAAPQPGASASTTPAKPVKIKKGGLSLLPVLYVIGGIIFLVVYTIIWAVVFGLSLPFGLSIPF